MSKLFLFILLSSSVAACALDEPCIEHAGECHDETEAEVDTPFRPNADQLGRN